ncbi:unnamed protein product, partial [Amoebophrya sp. A120]
SRQRRIADERGGNYQAQRRQPGRDRSSIRRRERFQFTHQAQRRESRGGDRSSSRSTSPEHFQFSNLQFLGDEEKWQIGSHLGDGTFGR